LKSAPVCALQLCILLLVHALADQRADV